MSKMNHEKLNRYSKVQGANPAMPGDTKKKRPHRPAVAGKEWVKLESKFTNTCLICKQNIKVGSKIMWNSNTKETVHSGCMGNMLRNGVNPDKPKVYKKGKNPFVASPIVRGWRDIK